MCKPDLIRKFLLTDYINLAKCILCPSQGETVIDSAQIQTWLMTGCLEWSIVHIGGFSPFQRFSEDAQPQVGYRLCDSSGSASHVAPPILAQCPCTIPHLAPGMPSLLGDPMLIQSCGSLEGPVHVSDQENGDYTPKWFRKYGLSTGGQRWTSLPQKTTLTAQFISQRSEMLWPTICQVLVCMPSLWLPCSLRSPLPSKRHDFAAPARPVEPSCLVPQWESWQLPMRVTNTILEARVPSMRHIYAIMWSLFSEFYFWILFCESCWIRGITLPCSEYMWQLLQWITLLWLASQSAIMTLMLSLEIESASSSYCADLGLIHSPQDPSRSSLWAAPVSRLTASVA